MVAVISASPKAVMMANMLMLVMPAGGRRQKDDQSQLKTNPNECNSDNIFWKWEMGKSQHQLKMQFNALVSSFSGPSCVTRAAS